MDSFWSGQCVIISGASSGIGRALAQHLAGCGANVGLIARRADLLKQLAATIRAGGGNALVAPADVTDAAATEHAVREIESHLGPCQVAIANAGIYRKTRAQQFDAHAARRVLDVNVGGVIHLFAGVLPGMVERRRGRLAAIASVGALAGLPGAGAYCASKAAVVTMLESLRVDLRGSGVRVTAVCPGFVDTPMLTDHERATIKGLISAEQAAVRAARAIRRGRAETWFPWHTLWQLRLASLLPPRLYERVMAWVPEMEETGNQQPVERK